MSASLIVKVIVSVTDTSYMKSGHRCRMEQDLINPKYLQLKSILVEQIKNGTLVPGTKLSTHRDLMSRYNLSCSTVSRALLELVHEGFICRKSGKGTFVATLSSLSKGGTEQDGNLGFIISRRFKKGFLNPFISEILEGIEMESRNIGYQLLLKTTTGYKDGDSEFLKSLIGRKDIKGIIFAGDMDDGLMYSLNGKYPLVWIHNCPKRVRVSCVVVDAINGAYKAVRYLSSLGHKEIGFISGPQGNLQAREELNGYKLGLKESGLYFKKDYVSEGDFEVDSGYHAMQILLKKSRLPRAVFAANDAMAIGAMKAISEHGLKIPNDISIVGFNDIEWSRHTNPPLTTVRVDKREIGFLSIRKLVDLIKGEKKYPLRTVVPTELVIRKSCGRV